MTGLVPVIPVVQHVDRKVICRKFGALSQASRGHREVFAGATTWMTGTSPVMTVEAVISRPILTAQAARAAASIASATHSLRLLFSAAAAVTAFSCILGSRRTLNLTEKARKGSTPFSRQRSR